MSFPETIDPNSSLFELSAFQGLFQVDARWERTAQSMGFNMLWLATNRSFSRWRMKPLRGTHLDGTSHILQFSIPLWTP